MSMHLMNKQNMMINLRKIQVISMQLHMDFLYQHKIYKFHLMDKIQIHK